MNALDPRKRGLFIPKFKLVLTFDTLPEMLEQNADFLETVLLPTLINNDVHLLVAWGTTYGLYPRWTYEFVAEELIDIDDLLQSEEWLEVEDQILDSAYNYSRKTIRYKRSFQFVANN